MIQAALKAFFDNNFLILHESDITISFWYSNCFMVKVFVDFLLTMRKFEITSSINKDTLSIGLEGISSKFSTSF